MQPWEAYEAYKKILTDCRKKNKLNKLNWLEKKNNVWHDLIYIYIVTKTKFQLQQILTNIISRPQGGKIKHK